jgi:hypothetical protein
MEQNSDSKNSKKTFKFFGFSLVRIIILFILLSASYLFFRQIEESEKQKTSDSHQLESSNNEDSTLSLSLDHAHDLKEKNIEDFAVNTIQEKGVEFIYRSIIKNQEEISYLKEQNQILKNEFAKFKNRENLAKIIFIYIDFRQKFFSAQNSDQEFNNLQAATIFDKDLYEKISKFGELKKNFINKEVMLQNFSNLIPELIAIKNSNKDSSLLGKVKYFFSKLIIIRKIDGKNISEFDQNLIEIERSINDQNYSEAMINLLKFEQKYHSTLEKFLQDLSISIEAKKIDEEVLSYLKNLS